MGRILGICTQVVAPPTDGGRQGIYYRWRALAQNYDLHVCMLDHNNQGRATLDEYMQGISYELLHLQREDFKFTPGFFAKLRSFAGYVFSGQCRWEYLLAESEEKSRFTERIVTEKYDVVLLEGCFAAALVDLPRLHAANIRTVVVEHNTEYQYFMDSLRLPGWLLWPEGRRIKNFEQQVLSSCDACIAVSPVDAIFLQRKFALENIKYNASYLPSQRDFWKQNNHDYICFCGALGFYPNIHGLKWFLQNVFRYYHQQHPEMKLKITGRVSETNQAYFRQFPNVELVGFLSEVDLHNLMLNARFSVIPVIRGSGVKIKLLEALSFGLPILTTDECKAGVTPFAEDEAPFFYTSDAAKFLAYMNRLTEDAALRRKLGQRGKKFFETVYASKQNLRAWTKAILGA